MRRHELIFRALKRRYSLGRPRYSFRFLWYGGATFTMLLFILLLISSGLMYFYYQKCQMQGRELEKWRAGIKVREDKALVTTTKSASGSMMSALRDRIIGMPAPQSQAMTQTAKDDQPSAKAEPAVNPSPKSEPAVSRAQPPASARDVSASGGAKRTEVAEVPRTPDSKWTQPENDAPESAQPQQEAAAARPASQGATVNVKIPGRTTSFQPATARTASAKPTTEKSAQRRPPAPTQDDIGNLLLSQTGD
jgi:hypothetical protein